MDTPALTKEPGAPLRLHACLCCWPCLQQQQHGSGGPQRIYQTGADVQLTLGGSVKALEGCQAGGPAPHHGPSAERQGPESVSTEAAGLLHAQRAQMENVGVKVLAASLPAGLAHGRLQTLLAASHGQAFHDMG